MLLTQDVAAQAGPFGVRVNCVAPDRFIPIPRRPDGRLEPEALDAALRPGFCIVRWHLGQSGQG